MASAETTIPEHLNADFFEEALRQGLYDAQLQVKDFEIENITTDGENYCSNIYQATVDFERGCRNEKISLIIKTMPERKQVALRSLKIYSKEIFFYLELKKKMEGLFMIFKDDWDFAAKYIFSCSEPEQTIVFEDLKTSKYLQQNREIGLDLEHSEMVLRQLAHFHATSLFLNEKEPNLLANKYPFGLLNMEAIKSDHFQSLFGAQLSQLISLLEKDQDFQNILPKLKNYHQHFLEKVLQAVYPLKGQLNVLNHGDLWVNNLFFKYDDSKRISQTKFIDFQLCFYGSLGFDVNYFLNTSLQLEVLDHHRESLINLYCEELLDSLKKFPFSNILPNKEQILEEIHQKEPYGFFVAFGFFPLMSMCSLDSESNSLENLRNSGFAQKKIHLMFTGNPRTMQTLKYSIKRFNDLGIFD